MKFNLKLLLLLIPIFFHYSCKDEEGTLEGDPQDIIDENHVLLDDRYGITAVFPKGEWSNSYLDTLPQSDFYKNYQYSAIYTGLYSDTIMKDDAPLYPTGMYFMRFHKKIDPSEFDDFAKEYKEYVYNQMLEAYYNEVSAISDTTIGGYSGVKFVADRGINVGDGYEEVVLFYHNSRTYGVTIITSDEKFDDSYPKCQDIVSTIKLK